MFGFPKADYSIKSSFKKNFLRTIVFQIQFDSTKVLFQHKTEIQSLFPAYVRLNDSSSNYEIQISPNETPIISSSKGEGFMLRTQDGSRSITFNTTSIDLNINGNVYTNFEDVATNELKIIVDLLGKYSITSISRIAIRKINVISLKIARDTSLVQISKDLLNYNVSESFGMFPANEKDIFQNINSVHYKNDVDNLILKMGHATIPNLDVGHFICDIDRFTVATIRNSEILDFFKSFNNEIFDVFVWFLNEKSLNILKNN